MPVLNGVYVPEHYNGVGMHDTPGSETAVWDRAQGQTHAAILRAHGVTAYKLFGSATKAQRALGYHDGGVFTIVRFWPGGAHWGLPPAEWVTTQDQTVPFVDAGVQLLEMGWNEFNLQDEWVYPIPGAEGIAKIVVDAWEVGLARCPAGAYPLFPSNTPGGHVSHRICYDAIVQELGRRGLMSTVKHVAVHPRPFNNPPNVPWSLTNTVTFDEWRWIADHFPGAYLWSTEHGYSLWDHQNILYPEINLGLWTDYNWDLFRWMDPEHDNAIAPRLAGSFYWFEAGYGHWGNWPEDAAVDSPHPEMPAPSPLWLKMGAEATSLAFTRYTEEVPVSNARGIDVSVWQGDIDWDAVAASGITFALIRASFATAGGTDSMQPAGVADVRLMDLDAGVYPDPNFLTNIRGARDAGLYVGAYHFLVDEIMGQAKGFHDAIAGEDLDLGAFVDVEACSCDKVRAFTDACRDNWGIYPVHVYTRASYFDPECGADPPWLTEDQDLWVAHWFTTDPAIPLAWQDRDPEWLFHQDSNNGQIPGIVGDVDTDRFWGTVQDLHDTYGAPAVVPPWQIMYTMYDGTNVSRAEYETEFGKFLTPFDPDLRYYIRRLLAVEGNQNLRIRVVRLVDGNWVAVPGVRVLVCWPDGYDEIVTNDDGWASHTMGSDSWYDPTKARGPYWVYVHDGDGGSAHVDGCGWIGGTQYNHFDLVFMQIEPEGSGGDLDVLRSLLLEALAETESAREKILLAIKQVEEMQG